MCVADAFCPHLGSHLGPETGGVIRAGNLVCPFHGFEFDVTGRYMTTPHAPPPKSARLKAYPMQEVNGFVFAYWDHAGRAPTWKHSRSGIGRQKWPGAEAAAPANPSPGDGI